VSPAQMREIEKISFEKGISSKAVMRIAGEKAASYVLENTLLSQSVLVVCGSGNNGGDGFVCADMLSKQGREADVLFIGETHKQSEDAKYYFEKVQHLLIEKADKKYDWIIDAIFGIGFKGSAQGKAAEAISFINSQRSLGTKVLAIDIPSGLDPNNGLVTGEAVWADVTITFQYEKTGQLLGQGLDLCGKLIVTDIGLLEMQEDCIFNPEEKDVAELFPKRKNFSHKGTYGHLGILAGSKGMEGAGALSALAALRSGAGKVSLGVPECCIDFYNNRAFEIMCQTLPCKDGHFAADFSALESFIKDKDAIIFGPGIGRNIEMAAIVKHIIEKTTVPLIIDADGLYFLAENDFLNMQKKQVILTPHLGEMARLCNCSISDVEENPIGIAQKFANTMNNILVLKSAYNIIASPKQTFIGAFGCAGMATAGSGDVLSGIIGALACILPLEQAAFAGAYIHGAAGKIAAVQKSETSMIASDIVNYLPQVFCKFNG